MASVPKTTNPAAVPGFPSIRTGLDAVPTFEDLVPDNLPDFTASRKRAAFASLLPALAFVPLVSSPAVYINSQPTEPIAIQSFQYESDTRPIAPPTVLTAAAYIGSQPTELISVLSFQYEDLTRPILPIAAAEGPITIDKWQRAQSEPLKTTRLIRTANATFAVVVQVVQVPAIYVGSQPTEPIAVRSFQYDDLAEPIVTTVAAEGPITVDKWQSAWPQPYFRKKRLVQYGVNFAIAEQADDGLPPVYWIPQTNTPSFDRWRAIRKQWLYPVSVSDQLFNVPVTVTPAVYIGSQPSEPLRLISFQYEDKTEPIRFTTAAEGPITVDKWYRITQAPLFDLKRNQRLYPVVVSDYLSQNPVPEIIRVDKWGRNYPDQVFRAKRLSTNGQYTVDPKQLTQIERTTLDKWYQPQSTPRRDVKRAQYLFQTLGIDTTVFTAIADWLAVQKDVRSITLYTAEAGTITLYVAEAGTTNNVTGDTRALFLLVKDDGIIPLS